MNKALFESAHRALSFAYTYSHTQHGTAAAAERQIALAARERYERTAGSGRDERLSWSDYFSALLELPVR